MTVQEKGLDGLRVPGEPEVVAATIVLLAFNRASRPAGGQFRVDGGILPTV